MTVKDNEKAIAGLISVAQNQNDKIDALNAKVDRLLDVQVGTNPTSGTKQPSWTEQPVEEPQIVEQPKTHNSKLPPSVNGDDLEHCVPVLEQIEPSNRSRTQEGSLKFHFIDERTDREFGFLKQNGETYNLSTILPPWLCSIISANPDAFISAVQSAENHNAVKRQAYRDAQIQKATKVLKQSTTDVKPQTSRHINAF